jgi:general secretion pathway protein L
MRATSLGQWREHLIIGWHSGPLRRFLRGWAHELRACLPPRLRGWLYPEPLRAYVRWPLTEPLGEVPEQARVVLLLPPEQVLVHTLSLPLAAARDLDSVLAFELDRFTPFRPEQVHYVARREGVVGGQLQITLALLPREHLETCLAACRQRGLAVASVDVLAASGQGMGLELLEPLQRRSRHSHRTRRLSLGLALLCGLLLAACMYTWLQQREASLASMRIEVQALRGQTAQLQALRQELADTLGSAAYLSQLKLAQPARAMILSELTTCLPSDTWLQTLQIDAQGQVDLSGFSARASSLINSLKGCPHLVDPQYQGIIQPDQDTGKDRFYLRAQLRRETANAPPPDTP